MKTYADTGFICSLYAPDAHSARAISRMNRHRLSMPVIWLHHLEFRNALRLRIFRREIDASQRDASLNAMLADLRAGIWERAVPEISDVLLEAERLSALHSETLGTRTLDILHVAAAVVLGAEEFLSFDRRQNALAVAAGLRTPRL